MNIELIYVPQFEVRLNRDFIAILEKCATAHYDRVCKESVQPGGFVYGWMNRLRFCEDDIITVQTSFRELDLVSKILEMTTHPNFVTPEQIKIAQSFCDKFSEAVQQMNAIPLIRCGDA